MEERKHTCTKKLYEPQKFNNIKEIINNTQEKFGNKPAFKMKTEKEGEFKEISYKDYIDEVKSLGTALISIGLKDKRIGVIGENRKEWQLSYLSIVCGTGIVVPLDKSLPENELNSLIARSEVEAIFYSSKYDEIILGTPVWWYRPAPVVRAFLKKYDLSGKKIIPFATNAGWLGRTFNEIKSLCPNSIVTDEMNIVFTTDYAENKLVTPTSSIVAWIDKLRKD